MSESLTDFLPPWLGNFVVETAEELQVPANAVAVLGLGAAASAINGGADSAPIASWREPVALYTLALLPSGEGKSPVFSRFFDPVMDASDEVADAQRSDVNNQKVRNRMNKKMLRKYETKQMNLVDAAVNGITFEEAVANVAAEEKRLRSHRATNVVPIRILTDTTPSGLLDGMEANEGRLVVASPEADALLGFRGGALDVVLKGFDGELLRQARRTTGEITIERPVINMVIAMQPSVLGSLGAGMVNRGFMPRFLMAYPETLVGKRDSRPNLVKAATSALYAESVTDIVKRFAKPGDPQTILWDKVAVREVGTWRDEIEPMLAPDGQLASIGAWGSKVRGAHFIRVAALLAIMDGKNVVSVTHARQAKGILRLLIGDAVLAFGEMGASFASDDLVHLMEIVHHKMVGQHFAKRDIMRVSNRFMKSAERCSDALDLAVAEGFIVKEGRGWRALPPTKVGP